MKNLLLSIIILLLTPSLTWPEQLENYCHDKASWANWDKLVADTQSIEIKTLYAIRIGFCTMIERHQITLDEAIDAFELYRQGLLKSNESPNENQKLTL